MAPRASKKKDIEEVEKPDDEYVWFSDVLKRKNQ
jgi:hypothetical protein